MTQISNTEAAALFFVLGNAKRLEIFRHLLDSEMSVGQIATAVGMSQSALSQHLAKMRDVGTVETRRDKQSIYYSCTCKKIRALIETIDHFCAPEAQGQGTQVIREPGDDE